MTEATHGVQVKQKRNQGRKVLGWIGALDLPLVLRLELLDMFVAALVTLEIFQETISEKANLSMMSCELNKASFNTLS